jgi:lipoate-protein ligase B
MLSVSRSTSETEPVVRERLEVGWFDRPQPYLPTWELQRRIHARRVEGLCADTLLLLEHEPVVTIGRNGKEANLLLPEQLLRSRGIDLVHNDRGGDVTYHGPGQLIGYPIVDLRVLHHDIHRFLREIEEGLILAVARWGIKAGRNPGKTGVWVGEEKLASIGLKASHWVTMHGFALNVTTDLTPFDLIVPCGIAGCRMTSIEKQTGRAPTVREVGDVVAEELARIWGRTPVHGGDEGWRI